MNECFHISNHQHCVVCEVYGKKVSLSKIPRHLRRVVWEHIKDTNEGLSNILEELNQAKAVDSNTHQEVPPDIMMLREIISYFDAEIQVSALDLPAHIIDEISNE